MVSHSYEANESSRAAKRQRRDLERDSSSAELDSPNPGNRRMAQPRSSVRASPAFMNSRPHCWPLMFNPLAHTLAFWLCSV